MKRLITASVTYFALVFGAGFVLGTVRVLWIAPRWGERAAELLEMPVMLVVIIIAAGLVVRRFALAPSVASRLGTGALALALLLTAEYGLNAWLRGSFADLDPVTDAPYYGALVVFALVPLFAPPAMARPWRAAALGALAVLATMASVVYISYRSDLAIERARVAMGSVVAETRCGPIEYLSLGDGPAVLLVHGAGGGYDQMFDAAHELADAGFHAVAVSRFGYLRTPLPADATPAAQAEAHACLLDALGIERAAVIGVSAGGPSAMQFAIRHAQRTVALVLLVPLAYAPERTARTLSPAARFMLERAVKSDFLYWATMTFDPDLVIGTILATPPELVARADLQERVRVATLMRQILPVSRREQGLLNEERIATSLAPYELERITAPTLVMSVQDDRYGTYAGARYSAANIPNARFIGYRTGGHLWVGHQEELMRELLIFLGAGPAGGAAR